MLGGEGGWAEAINVSCSAPAPSVHGSAQESTVVRQRWQHGLHRDLAWVALPVCRMHACSTCACCMLGAQTHLIDGAVIAHHASRAKAAPHVCRPCCTHSVCMQQFVRRSSVGHFQYTPPRMIARTIQVHRHRSGSNENENAEGGKGEG